jgi:methylenetetrahydrofolate dehydrogenase (NADP+)/methenyltetrahydrofolate cyclohydrolase
MSIIIDGKKVSAECRKIIKEETAILKTAGIIPGLAVIIVGTDPASQVYVRNKCKACEEVGFNSFKYELEEDTSEEALLTLINALNSNPAVNGILVQMPLPKHISTERVMRAISPSKDVDAFHPENVGRLVAGTQVFNPCTPAGIMKMLEYYNISVEGKHCVVVGRSDIVGKPMMHLLLQANGTVTVCHSKTKYLPATCRDADILITAIGKPKFFDQSYVKPGAVVIDVGINRDASGELCGDVDFEKVAPISSYITPVPGGCGPMTITMLLQNTLVAAKN